MKQSDIKARNIIKLLNNNLSLTEDSKNWIIVVLDYPGSYSDSNVCFSANDENEAQIKAVRWARSQGMGRDDVKVRPASSEDISRCGGLHNEWVS